MKNMARACKYNLFTINTRSIINTTKIFGILKFTVAIAGFHCKSFNFANLRSRRLVHIFDLYIFYVAMYVVMDIFKNCKYSSENKIV